MQCLQVDVDGCTILMTDLIVNHHKAAETALPFIGISYTEAAYIDALLLVNFNWALFNFHKRDLQCTLVLLFLFVLFFYLFIYFKVDDI